MVTSEYKRLMMNCVPLDYADEHTSNSTIAHIALLDNLTFESTTNFLYEGSQNIAPNPFDDDFFSTKQTFENFENVIYKFIIPMIGLFGFIGNILNLVILTRKTVTMTMNRMEKSSHTGLTALALSDLLFCMIIIPHAWIPSKQFSYETRGFGIYYSIYSEAFISIFIMSSTWLTVIISVSRYFAVVHPIKARDITGMTFSVSCILFTFLISILFNIPRFLNERISSIDCVGGFQVYFKESAWFKQQLNTRLSYLSVYFVLIIFIPFLTLVYCNVFLIRALKKSIEMREQYQPTSKKVKDSAQRITLTLIIIVIMYIILVIPGETIHFLITNVLEDSASIMYYNFSLSILNVFQAINFSFNFILYCVVNVHFRKTVITTFCPRYVQKVALSNEYASVASRSVTATTHL